MITTKEDILNIVVDTVDDLKQGDTFLILLGDYKSVYIMTDSDYFVDLKDGSTYEVYEHPDYPVRKIDYELTELKK